VRDCSRRSRSLQERSLYGFDPLPAHVLLDLGNIPYAYTVFRLLQWTDRYAATVSSIFLLTIEIEGLIIACSIMILSGVYGPTIWTQPITDLAGHPEVFGTYSIIDLWIPMLLFTFFVAHLPACVNNVVKARRAQNLPIAPVFLEWTPIIVFTGACGAWLYSPYSTLLQQERLVLFCLTMSFVFGRMTTKIILAHLTRQPFPYWTVMLVPLIGGALLANLPRLGCSRLTVTQELWYLRAYFCFAVVAYFRWAILVVNSICNYLDINCLTITKRLAPGQMMESTRGAANGSTAEKKNA